MSLLKEEYKNHRSLLYMNLPGLKSLHENCALNLIVLSLFLIGIYQNCSALPHSIDKEPDSVYLFSYSTAKNNNHNGLHFAWSTDKKDWFLIGNEYSFVRCDYGRWGKEKRMLTPFLFLDGSGVWHCLWSVNEYDHAFAHVSTPDLVYWGRQSYPLIARELSFIDPIVEHDGKIYTIKFRRKENQYFEVKTKDFKVYSEAKQIEASQYRSPNVTLSLESGTFTGQVHRVSWSVAEKLIQKTEVANYRAILHDERTQQDNQRFAGLQPVNASFTVHTDAVKPISNLLLGVFFEDINYAADGGLYAELIQNRDFEYTPGDREHRDATWNSKHSWKLQGTNATFSVDTIDPIHSNNNHYAVLTTTNGNASLINTGFDGITVKKGDKFNLSLFVKRLKGSVKSVNVSLVTQNGKEIASGIISVGSASWKNIKTVLTATDSASGAQLAIRPLSAGSLAVDMVSLFPQQTFKGRKNGLRHDLAQTIADIHPKFIRFPGGCVAHGDGIENIYRWKNTVGPLESRKPQRNLWGYHQTAGLGYFEYFQYCEDIGAVPLPVLAAGVPCQNSGTGGAGQQGGVPLDEMDEYIQDIFDLVEYANGSAKSRWGKLRADAGHPQPFNLKYIGIGNEDLISDVFEERFKLIFNAMKEKHPEIVVIGTVGPTFEGTDYTEGWKIANTLQVPIVDEHYYQSPGWFIHNQEYYDKYDRSKSKVYLGEYASHLPGRPNNVETALSEALYLTALERNGDVVTMSSYAPLLAKDGHTQWNPNLIYFDNKEVKPTVGYYVQKMFGQNAGDQYLPASTVLSNNEDGVKKRIAISVVRDSKSNDLIVKLVNMLPVNVNAQVDLTGLVSPGSTAKKIELQGDPADKNAKPQESSITITDKSTLALNPYSVTVIRLAANRK